MEQSNIQEHEVISLYGINGDNFDMKTSNTKERNNLEDSIFNVYLRQDKIDPKRKYLLIKRKIKL